MCEMALSKRLENVEFFKGKRVLVTGHTGFMGAWLSAVLNIMGADAAGYALAPQPGGMYEKLCGDSLIHHVAGNLLDSSLLEQTVSEFQPEIVLHLAGNGWKQDGMEEPVLTYQTNVMGSAVLLDALRKCHSVKSIVLVSVCPPLEGYGSLIQNDGEAFCGAGVYSGSKMCMEYVARDYYELYFHTESRMTGVAVVRVGNASDPSAVSDRSGQKQAGILPSDAGCTEEKNGGGRHRLQLSGSGRPVLDVLDGCLTIARLLFENPAAHAGAWEIGLGQSCGTQPDGAGIYRQREESPQQEASQCQSCGETERESCMREITEYYGKARQAFG